MRRAPRPLLSLVGARRVPFPGTMEPMLATMGDRPFDDPNWLFEPKLDGIRTVALVQRGSVKALSRRGLDITFQYPRLVEELARTYQRDLVFDGEIVALDEQGRPSFQLLQGRLNLTRKDDILRAEGAIPIVYFVFDLLYLDGFDLQAVPLEIRKEALSGLLVPSDQVHLVEHFVGEGIAAYEAAVAHGLEGLIAKRRSAGYQPGRRSRDWLKIKATRSDEFVIGGYTQGSGWRSEGFGALLLGYLDERGRLRYAGHVGTGFDERAVAELRAKLDAIRSDRQPFAEQPPLHAPATWVEPKFVAEVKYAERTREGHLRAPVFLRLRPDVPPEDVRPVEITPATEAERADRSQRGPATEAERAMASVAREAISAIEQLERPANNLILRVGEHDLALNNLDKELWPAVRRRRALTKRDLIVYLAKVAPYILPYMRDRPLTLVRYPHGIGEGHFFQKHWANPLPEFVETVRLFSEQAEEDQDYLVCNNLPTLLWLGQIADLELHCWLARTNPEPDARHLSTTFIGSVENVEASALNYPDFIAFDLDPYIYSGMEASGAEPELNRKGFAKVCQVALWLKETLDELGLRAFVKTSGATGLHIFVPIRRDLSYDEVRAASGTIARHLLREHPRDITIEWRVVKRTSKVFVDYNQNTRGKTLATIYSPRAIPAATVSMPVDWSELFQIYPTDFTILTAPDLIPAANAKWEHILEAKQDVSKLGAESAADSGPSTRPTAAI